MHRSLQPRGCPAVKEEPNAAESPGTSEAIDFHAPEFNVVDDLNDWAAGRLSYEPLGDVVTADMRHQMERRCNRPGEAQAGGPETRRENEFEAALPNAPGKAPPLTVVSHGRTLVIDTDGRRAEECASRLEAQGLQCTVVLTKAGAAHGRGFSPDPLRADSLSVSGAFGGFSASAAVNGNRKPLEELLADRDLSFDLVLDLQPEPSYTGERLPAGYYAPGRDPSGLEGALGEMPQMRGRFVRPQFTAFLADRCIHGRSRKHECRRCIDACPWGAIESVDRKITLNPYVCQGCGACTLACPTDAIALLEPSRRELLETVRRAVQAGEAGRRQAPVVVISDSETPADAGSGFTPCRVDQIGHVGLELILAAMAFGAGRVIVAGSRQEPPCIRNEVDRQVQMADAVLQGLGLPGRTILLTNGGAEPSPCPSHAFLPPVSDELTATPDSRAGIRRIVQHLYVQSELARPRIAMPEGTPFGAVTVDPARCTLCMACAVACPSGALSAGGDIPRLSFIESRCHQCGLCRDACPEQAIRLEPRILCDPDAVSEPAVLREAEPFRCVACGKPFATQAMVNRMLDKLAGHWMYANERQRRRLQMCHVCRTRDALKSEDRETWTR